MRLTTSLTLAAALFAAVATADEETALKLRLESIEARLPDVERLDNLERRVAALADGEPVRVAQASGNDGGGELFSLYQDLQSLKQEVRELRGQVEELQHRTRQREQRQRDLYQDLDSRLRALEKNGGGATGTAGAGGEDGGPPEGNPEAAEKAYLAAFDKLKQGDQKAAIEDFKAFVEAHPNSEYTDNAWYWLGQAHYVERNYGDARQALERVVQDFPGSNKAPDAKYKIGVIQDEQGDYKAARKTLRGVVEDHPKADAAELARKRLQALEGADGQ